MGDKTGINWTDATWAPARGCSRISEGCRNCYAERIAARFSKPGQPFHGFAQVVAPRDLLDATGGRRNGWTRKVAFQPDQLAVPLRWKRPRRIFCSSMTDIFHESLANEEIAAMFGVMAACPQHTFQCLTKRPKRMREWFAWVSADKPEHQAAVDCYHDADELLEGRMPVTLGLIWPLPNVWIGTSVEDQDAADERIPDLLATSAAVRFLSCEPLLGPLDLSSWLMRPVDHISIATGEVRSAASGLSWIIAGCESGPGARPCDVAWLRSLRDQCAAASVPYFLKQAREVDGAMTAVPPPTPLEDRPGYSPRVGPFIPTIGFGTGSKRKAAGGIIELPYLDGVQHADFPTTRAP